MTTSFRQRDMAVERSLAEFLDHYLYTDPKFTKALRTDDTSSQFNGSDIIISIPSCDINDAVVDEKGQLNQNYINKPLPTFALELSFLSSSGDLIEGWFIDNSKSTTHYLFLWIKRCKNPEMPNCDDFQEVEYVFVSKKKLSDYFESEGLTNEVLREKSKNIRETGINGAHEKGEKPYYFFYSKQLAEKPINIVVRKYKLNELADIKGTINKNDLETC